MHVLLLNYEYPPLGGGAGNATRFLLQEFAAYPDLHIDVVTSGTGAAKTKHLTPNITVHFLDIGKKEKNLQRQSNRDLLAYARAARRFLPSLQRGTHFDLVHAFFAVPSGYIALQTKLPLIVSLRGSDVPNHNPAFAFVYRLLAPFIKKTLRDARVVVANSEDLRSEATAFFQRDYAVIPNGIDTTFFTPGAPAADTFSILTAGRLHRVKNIDLLLRGFATFRADEPRAKLTITGDGPEAQNLRRLAVTLGIADSVHFLGHCTKEALRDAYQRCTVFALLSTNEGMSNTVLEAMACGAPILATNTGGIGTLVSARNGYILHDRTVRGVQDGLAHFAAQRAAWPAMRAESRRVAEAHTWKKSAAAYYDLYKLCAA